MLERDACSLEAGQMLSKTDSKYQICSLAQYVKDALNWCVQVSTIKFPKIHFNQTQTSHVCFTCGLFSFRVGRYTLCSKSETKDLRGMFILHNLLNIAVDILVTFD